MTERLERERFRGERERKGKKEIWAPLFIVKVFVPVLIMIVLIVKRREHELFYNVFFLSFSSFL